MFNEKSKVIEEHGTRGGMAIDEKYYLISDSSLVEDEVGNKFGPKGVSWSAYLLLHEEILFESQVRSGSAELLTVPLICL